MKDISISDLLNKEPYLINSVPKTVRKTNEILQPEDTVWKKFVCSKLTNLCLVVLAENFSKQNCYRRLPLSQRGFFAEVLSTEIDLSLVLPFIEEDYYWKRRFEAHFENVSNGNHFGWTWKCTYMEKLLQNVLTLVHPESYQDNKLQKFVKFCSPYIHVFELNQNNLSQIEHIENFFVNLKNNFQLLPKIQEVYLDSKTAEDIGDSSRISWKISSSDLNNLSKAISVVGRLKLLRIHSKCWDCKGVWNLTKRKISWYLVIVDFSFCNIGDVGAKCLAKFCYQRENLKVLKLRGNRIGLDGVRGLAYLVLLRAPLECLDLSENPLGSEGIQELCTALPRSTKLRALFLSDCNGKEEPRVRLGVMLRHNLSLLELDVSNNALHPDEGKEILKAFEDNLSLLSLNLKNTGIASNTRIEIQACLKNNSERKKKNYSLYCEEENITFIDYNTVIISI